MKGQSGMAPSSIPTLSANMQAFSEYTSFTTLENLVLSLRWKLILKVLILNI